MQVRFFNGLARRHCRRLLDKRRAQALAAAGGQVAALAAPQPDDATQARDYSCTRLGLTPNGWATDLHFQTCHSRTCIRTMIYILDQALNSLLESRPSLTVPDRPRDNPNPLPNPATSVGG